jgi:Fur family ferric uptake transcriptional regulator
MPATSRERFLAYLGSRHLRLTAQRRLIVEVVFNAARHFTADQLLDWARRQDPSISRATVYRTLPLLTQSGLVRELDFGQDRKVYDPNYADRPNHSHITCRDCGRVVEFESEELVALAARLGLEFGFGAIGQKLHIDGVCELRRRGGGCPYFPGPAGPVVNPAAAPTDRGKPPRAV